MPIRHLPLHPDFAHLRHQAKNLHKAHAARELAAAQRLREFHPRFRHASDAEIFADPLRLADAQLVIARSYGLASWTRLRHYVAQPPSARRWL